MLDTTHYPLRSLPIADRPRERLARLGPEALSTAELIAVILGSGMKGKSVLQLAQEVVAHVGSIDRLSQATVAELCQIKGMGEAKAIQLLAAVGLGMKANREPVPNRLRIDNPNQAYQLIKNDLENEQRELFVVILQDIRRQVIRHEVVAVGTLSRILVHPREVFYPAIRHKASSLIVAHNHPSGDPSPSDQDYRLTTVLVDAGKLVGIPVTDHLIIGKGRYLSLRQHGTKFD